MAYRQTCLVASDEEDEDGNLSEAAHATENKSVPPGEVIYLPADTSNLQPEEEDATYQQKNTRRQQKVSVQSIKVKAIDSLIKTSEDKEKIPGKANNGTSSGDTVNKSDTLKAADLMPSPLKRGNTTIVQSNNYKKAKYARQATPICDAIMKEYSKRQRVMKQKGSLEVSDLPIQELLKKAKSKEISQNNEKDKPSTSNNAKSVELQNAHSEESLEEKSTDPLTIVKQEIIDIKPEILYVSVDSIDVKPEKDIFSDSSASVKNNRTDANVSNNNDSPRGRGRGRGRGRQSKRGGLQKYRKLLSDEDDTDEDPDFDPCTENMKSNRITRSGRRITNPDRYKEDKVSMPETLPNDKNQESAPIPKDEVISVAERLKNLAEKIADVLTKEPSPNINIEAEKLLHTTQELIEMQKKKLKCSENIPSGSTIKIKQEITDPSENGKEILPQSSVEISSSVSSQSSTQNSIHIFNQLQRHEAALQKKISETVSKNDLVDATNPMIPNLPRTGNMISGPVSVQEKCTFIMDFFTSYQEVFDEYTVNEAIPILASNILLCINELNDCIQRTKNAETLKSENLKQQEIILAKQSYLKTIMNSGKKFFPWFNILIDKIKKTKTVQVLVSTLIFYIAGSLSIKAPKLKSHLHRLRRILLFMFKAHGYYYPFISQVLQTPNDVFEGQVKLIKHMLKYFQARKFLHIPGELLCNIPDGSEAEEKQFETELSIMDTAILKRIDPFVSVVDRPMEGRLNQNDFTQLGIPSSSAVSAENQTRLSNVPVEFVEALRNERDGNTKRIEQKLDYILNVLSGKGEYLGKHMNTQQQTFQQKIRPQVKLEKGITDIQNFNVRVNLGKRVPNIPTVKLNAIPKTNAELTMSSGTRNYQPTPLPEDKGILLAQLLQNDHSGLDSLFSSFLSSSKDGTTVRVKTEPVDIAESSNKPADIPAQSPFVQIKQEPSDELMGESGTGEPNPSNTNDQSLLEDAIFHDSLTEEYNFTKTEDVMDTDPFS